MPGGWPWSRSKIRRLVIHCLDTWGTPVGNPGDDNVVADWFPVGSPPAPVWAGLHGCIQRSCGLMGAVLFDMDTTLGVLVADVKLLQAAQPGPGVREGL